MKGRVELLAPAGSREAFLAAVENGADAVYLGGKLFNARQFAENFDMEQLKWAADYAHVRDARVYLTMNTLMADSELGQAMDFAQEAYLAGIDGVIVQDVGFASLLREAFPDLSLHASTQMTIYSLEGVKTLEKLGFKRVVLARELSMEEIKHIAANTEVELEVFVHGALCISYSGQCLMSSMIGGRSGNRGKCAQPCRLPYGLVGGSSEVQSKAGHGGKKQGPAHPSASARAGVREPFRYLLSPKDLCAVELLGPMVDTGVKSLKIEGRMKSPEYVATVVRVYRKYLDRVQRHRDGNGFCTVEGQDLKDLAQIFNRGGFSQGYLRGKPGREGMCLEKPKNWGIYLGEILSYDRLSSAFKIKLEEELSLGDGVEVWNGEEGSPDTVVSEIKLDGSRVDRAAPGQTVTVGHLKGRLQRGNKVYKTSDKNLNAQARETFSGKFLKKIKIRGRLSVKRGEPVDFWVRDPEGNQVCAGSSAVPQEALNSPLVKERIAEQLKKTGNTPFEFEEIEIELDENLALPVRVINELRRSALEELEALRARRFHRKPPPNAEARRARLPGAGGGGPQASMGPGPAPAVGGQDGMPLPRREGGAAGLSLLFHSWNEAFNGMDMAGDRVYLPLGAFVEGRIREASLCSWRKKGVEVFIHLPPVTRGRWDKILRSGLGEIVESGIGGFMIGNLGHMEYVKSPGPLKIVGDFSLNVFNSISEKKLLDLGLDGITLSPELNLAQLARLQRFEGLERETVVYGRLPLMTSEYCPVGSTGGGPGAAGAKCSGACKKGTYRLRDRKGMEFPVLCSPEDCRSRIFNSKVLFVPDSLEKLKRSGINRIRLDLLEEEPEMVERITGMYRDVWENGQKALEKYGALVDRIKGEGFTRGHYFRGV
ncbi:MAG: DUF3656 domain-containing protein [Clostridiales bacterium]|jgi:putative protease|nr:U32 family peptidase [Eubacteriales bacterium]MDH7566083.1 DUF3656 domain-containing protein [Clostridiales bacterium]